MLNFFLALLLALPLSSSQPIDGEVEKQDSPQETVFQEPWEQWRPIVEFWAGYYGLSVGRAMQIMQCESGGNPEAYNWGPDAGSVYGLYQHREIFLEERSLAWRVSFNSESVTVAPVPMTAEDLLNPSLNIGLAMYLAARDGWRTHWGGYVWNGIYWPGCAD